MFSKLRVGARKVGGRNKDRPASRDSAADGKPVVNKTNAYVLAPPDDHFSEYRPGTSDSRASFVASSAPILPPIPRVASQVERRENAPSVPTIRTVGVEPQIQEEASPSPSASPSPNDAEVEQGTGDVLAPTSSMDKAKARLLADKDHMDAMLMPPPAKKSSRSNMRTSPAPPSRAWTDLNAQLLPSRALERPASRDSSIVNEVPTPYRLDEPKEYITPAQLQEVEYGQPPRPKSRLRSLNPLSYLSRKRHSQMPVEGVDNSALLKRASFTPFQNISKTFDPRIIGEGVHDFSAPKPSQYVSIQDLRSLAAELPPATIYSDPRRGSDSNLQVRPKLEPSPERRHVPVFKEDFSDSAEGWRLDPEDRRNRKSTNIVDKVAALEKAEKEEKRKSALPAFAQHMPQDLPDTDPGEMLQTPSPLPPSSVPEASKISPKPPTEPDLSSLLYTPNSIQQTPDSLKPPKDSPRADISPGASPLADKSLAASPETPQTLSSLPRHMRSKTASVKSTASRFSFDMIGSGSAAQEKMLEERHRQRAAQRARAASMGGASINEEDDFNEDDIDFDDGLDEDIPGMNDDDDDEYGFSGRGVANMTLDMQNNTYSRHDAGGDIEEGEEEFPGLNDEDDADEFGTSGIGGGGLGNMTLDSIGAKSSSINSSRHMPKSSDGSIRGLGLRTDLASSSKDAPNITLTPVAPVDTVSKDVANPLNETSPLRDLKDQVDADINDLSNDNFYFDDGEFDDEFVDDYDNVQADDEIDESFLDNDFERGKPLPTLSISPLQNTAVYQDDSSQPSTRPTSLDSDLVNGNRHSRLTADTSRTSLQARRSSAYGQHAEAEASAGLTQENLAAYHNALAHATNQAALQGRFDWEKSNGKGAVMDSPSNEQQQKHRLHQDALPRESPKFTSKDVGGAGDDDDDFDFDDSMDDDAIIAAANAEALENDDDGFYGSEFGFFAYAGGSNEVQAFHGGFFGPGTSNQVKRSHSGRHDFQEPNLTPITERSEWSNRNSMISLAMHGTAAISPGGLSIPAPGLAQLADQMQHEGASSMDDMSLGALMRARRTAFGGSSTSLPSMSGGGGSRSGSPSQFIPLQGSSPLNNNSSGYGYPPPVPEEGEPLVDISAMPNPMLSLQTQNLTLRPTTSSADSSPLKRAHAGMGRPGHSRTSSSAESVSYQMERDEDGGNQWVIERRRTLDNGETEVLGRELVQGTL